MIHFYERNENNAYGMRHQHDWMVVDEPNFEMSAPQVD